MARKFATLMCFALASLAASLHTLADLQIVIPGISDLDKGGVHYFCIEVTQQANRWLVWHRYNEFKSLKAKLGPKVDNSNFPGKIYPFSLDARRAQLEAWLQNVLKHSKILPGDVLRDFLDDNATLPQATEEKLRNQPLAPERKNETPDTTATLAITAPFDTTARPTNEARTNSDANPSAPDATELPTQEPTVIPEAIDAPSTAKEPPVEECITSSEAAATLVAKESGIKLERQVAKGTHKWWQRLQNHIGAKKGTCQTPAMYLENTCQQYEGHWIEGVCHMVKKYGSFLGSDCVKKSYLDRLFARMIYIVFFLCAFNTICFVLVCIRCKYWRTFKFCNCTPDCTRRFKLKTDWEDAPLSDDFQALLRQGQLHAALALSSVYSAKEKGRDMAVNEIANVGAIDECQMRERKFKLLHRCGCNASHITVFIWREQNELDETLYVTFTPLSKAFLMWELCTKGVELEPVNWADGPFKVSKSTKKLLDIVWEELVRSKRKRHVACSNSIFGCGKSFVCKSCSSFSTHGFSGLSGIIAAQPPKKILFAGISHGAVMAQAAALRFALELPHLLPEHSDIQSKIFVVSFNAYRWTNKAGEEIVHRILGDHLLHIVMSDEWLCERRWDSVPEFPSGGYASMRHSILLDVNGTFIRRKQGEHFLDLGSANVSFRFFRRFFQLHFAMTALRAIKKATIQAAHSTNVQVG